AENVKLMKDTVKDALEVKASGGIRTLETAKEMISAGADRIGASASVSIMNELKA
ncbi:MAG: 2-deoxyribose-5-phosphate aldolase, partial [Clostridia bacterium]|nr:2-deoxyribose-5-phosphate aldolase [Clostridia bacterium]